MMGKGYILFSPELLIQALRLPYGTTVYGSDWDFEKDAMKLFVTHPNIPEKPEGAHVRRISYSDKEFVILDGNTS